MRVIAGEAKGRSLLVPRGRRVRPSGSRLREALFGMLDHRGAVDDARVLDLFAGAGALGIEALSRGASALVAVESDAAVARVLAGTLERCRFAPRARVLVQPVVSALRRLSGGEPFDLVLIDPPYRSGAAVEALHALVAGRLLTPGATLAVETASGEVVAAPVGLRCEAVRTHGDSQIALFMPDHPAGCEEGASDARH
jgi:16S rRNA (guanine966-N2)-methyltransferase